MNETVIWALPAGKSDRLYEQLMICNRGVIATADCAKIKAAASKDGWHSFRVVQMDLNAKPDFVKSLLGVTGDGYSVHVLPDGTLAI